MPQNAILSSITIRNIPDETMTRLKVRAAQTGQSLQEYLLELITLGAQQPTLAETAERTQR
ncbi:FitA-like ribbon-helix-helix domain-containing protein [Streptomyces sp. NBC_01602]|uniref:FitA-like ribbon-helix-helix domain-containing protein n=1 Tax=Streptomyces sp. NBC_01602 TaxID=2975893 RepID=UPI003867A23C